MANDINFSIGGTVITYQPSGIHEIYPDVQVYPTLGGARVIVEPTVGPIIECVWGVDAARAAVISELRTRRSSSGSVSISYIDATGTAIARTVYMPKVPYQQFLRTNIISQLTLQFYTL